MGLFRRSRPVVPAEPDEAFPFLGVEEAGRFRSLVREAFAGCGREVTVHSGYVVDSGGTQFGLTNVAAECNADERGERAWPRIVRRHVERIVRSVDAPSPFATLSRDEVLGSTYLRVMAAQDVLPWMAGHAEEVSEDLRSVLALDRPETVHFFRDEEVERFGPLAELRAAGLRNLRGVVPDEHEVLRRDGGTVHVLNGDSLFVASLLLLLPEVVARYNRPLDPELGAFVAVPNRHQLDFHLLADAGAVPSLQVLTRWAFVGCEGTPGAITPEVYWWRPARVERLTTYTDEGVRIDVGPELGDVLDRLAG